MLISARSVVVFILVIALDLLLAHCEDLWKHPDLIEPTLNIDRLLRQNDHFKYGCLDVGRRCK